MTPEQWAEAYRRLYWKVRRDLIEHDDLVVFKHAGEVLRKAEDRRPVARYVRPVRYRIEARR
jgi:hypothetical protein